jgi:hypothetical protein
MDEQAGHIGLRYALCAQCATGSKVRSVRTEAGANLPGDRASGVETVQLPARMRLMAALVFMTMALVVSACSLIGPPAPPEHGELGVGQEYRVTLWCPESFELGDWLWRFDDTSQWPPPADPNVRWQPRDPAPGIVTLTSAEEGFFVADSDHKRYEIVRFRPAKALWLCPGL